MQKIFLVLMFLPFGVFAQKSNTDLSPYKYLFINNLNAEFVDRSYGVTSAIANAFSTKGFIIANKLDQNNLPEDLRKNPCLMLILTPFYTAGSFYSTTMNLKVDIINCNNENIYSNTVSGTGWGTLAEGSAKTIKRLTKEINGIIYKFNPVLTPEFNAPISADYKFTNTGISEDSIRNYLDNNSTDPVEGIYKSFDKKDTNQPTYKFGVIKKSTGKYQAIIIDSESKYWKGGEIKMIIENTSIKDIFSVQFFMQDKSKMEVFASLANNLLKVDFSNSTEKQTSTFLKVYPQNISEVNSGSRSEIKKGLIASGTGFLISEKGLVVTNFHVISSGDRFTATNTESGKTYDVEIVQKDEVNDLAVLKIKNLVEPFPELPYTISTNVKVGQNVFTIGYPLNDVMGENQKVTNGIVNALTGIKDDTRYYQISVPIQPGNSGGALFDLKGGLIGITTATLNPEAVKTNVQNVNYAIKVNVLQNLISLLPGESFKITNSELGRELPLSILADKYKMFVFKINSIKE